MAAYKIVTEKRTVFVNGKPVVGTVRKIKHKVKPKAIGRPRSRPWKDS